MAEKPLSPKAPELGELLKTTDPKLTARVDQRLKKTSDAIHTALRPHLGEIVVNPKERILTFEAAIGFCPELHLEEALEIQAQAQYEDSDEDGAAPMNPAAYIDLFRNNARITAKALNDARRRLENGEKVRAELAIRNKTPIISFTILK